MAIRISSNQVLDAGIDSMNNSLVDATAWQKRISSGKNYTKASDNIYAVSRGVELDFDISRLKMFKSNQDIVTSFHDNAQTQMDSILNQLTTLKQLFVQAQNSALSPANYNALRIQAETTRDTILSQMVAKDASGHAIFPGEVGKVQIEPNVMVDSGVNFEMAFGIGGLQGQAPESSELYTSVDNFVNYLYARANGADAIKEEAMIISDNLNASFDQLMAAQQTSGAISSQADRSKNAMTSLGTELAAASSAILDTDMAEATAAYTRSQTLLNAAQAMFARLQQSNLFSKL
jgi:flagellin-like hook-associated protein FlgL